MFHLLFRYLWIYTSTNYQWIYLYYMKSNLGVAATTVRLIPVAQRGVARSLWILPVIHRGVPASLGVAVWGYPNRVIAQILTKQTPYTTSAMLPNNSFLSKTFFTIQSLHFSSWPWRNFIQHFSNLLKTKHLYVAFQNIMFENILT